MNVSCLVIGCMLGDAASQVVLGCMWEDGEGGDKDDKKAFELFQLAAKQGGNSALYNLGLMYDNGKGVAQGRARGVSDSRRHVQTPRWLHNCFSKQRIKAIPIPSVVWDSCTAMAEVRTSPYRLGIRFAVTEECPRISTRPRPCLKLVRIPVCVIGELNLLGQLHKREIVMRSTHLASCIALESSE